jgi:hypothetical protein
VVLVEGTFLAGWPKGELELRHNCAPYLRLDLVCLVHPCPDAKRYAVTAMPTECHSGAAIELRLGRSVQAKQSNNLRKGRKKNLVRSRRHISGQESWKVT